MKNFIKDRNIRRRFERLCKFLETLTPSQFDMTLYKGIQNGSNSLHLTEHSCGTIGCALGWTPIIFPKLTKDLYCWVDVPETVFNIASYSEDWNYLFSSDWGDYEAMNTIEATVARIRDYIKNGIPEKWNYPLGKIK